MKRKTACGAIGVFVLGLSSAGSAFAYGGQEPDAAWRAEAEQRIDQIRKADLSVVLTHADGTPIENASVRVMMQEHAFRFGTAVSTRHVLGTNNNSQLYRQKLLDLGFNTATIENSLKWVAIEGEFGPQYGLDDALDTIDWLSNNGIDTRGHVLVWPGKENLPAFIDTLIDQTNANVPGAREQLEHAVLDHVTSTVTATAGKVIYWDVVNEIGFFHDLLDIYGEDVMDDWFAAARAADPNARLFINEFDIITEAVPRRRESYLDEIMGLISRGAPIDGIGMQGHFKGGSVTDIGPGDGTQTVWEILDMYHDATGLPIAITEYDLDTTNEQLQIDYMRDFMTAVFAHEAVEEFIIWGFWAGRHWRPNAAMVEQDWTENGMAEVWRDLVLDQWWTDEEAFTDADGTLDLRVFQGDYRIEVDVDGTTLVYEVFIGPDGYTLQARPLTALPGDTDGDGDIDEADLGEAFASYTGPDSAGNKTFANGDTDGDGDVDDADLGAIFGNYSGPTSAPANVPEPAAGLVLLGLLIPMRRRRGNTPR